MNFVQIFSGGECVECVLRCSRFDVRMLCDDVSKIRGAIYTFLGDRSDATASQPITSLGRQAGARIRNFTR